MANGNGKPKQITAAQKEAFLAYVREGMTRPQAAKATDATLTGSKFRTLSKHDPAFDALYEEARAEGRGNFQDTIRAEFHRRAFDHELGTYSHRFLRDLFLIHCDEAAVLRRVEVGTSSAEDVKQQIDVAIESVLDELAARREARAVRASTPGLVAGDSPGAAT